MQSFPHDFRTTIAFHLSPNPHKQKPWQCLVSRQVLYMIISSRKQNQLQHFQQHYTLLLLRIIIIIIIMTTTHRLPTTTKKVKIEFHDERRRHCNSEDKDVVTTVWVPEHTLLTEAASQAGVHIPTLCHHPRLPPVGRCGLCVVSVDDGHTPTQLACSTFCHSKQKESNNEGHRLRRSSHHHDDDDGDEEDNFNNSNKEEAKAPPDDYNNEDRPADMVVRVNGTDLNNLSYAAFKRNMDLTRMIQSEFQTSKCGGGNILEIEELGQFMKQRSVDNSSASITYDPSLCIGCSRCVRACSSHLQDMNVLELPTTSLSSNDHLNTGIVKDPLPCITTRAGRPLRDTDCISCGQCTVFCPTGAIKEVDHTPRVMQALTNPEMTVVVQMAPSTRVTLSEMFGGIPGECSEGRLVGAARASGFHYVFDTLLGADLTIMEEAHELLQRLHVAQHGTKEEKERSPLPMFTSCCPGWVNLVEQSNPRLIPHLSTCRSPMSMLSSVIRYHWWPHQTPNRDQSKIFVVAVMPCTAKKDEMAREQLKSSNGQAETNAVLTVREFGRLLELRRVAQINNAESFRQIPESEFDNPFGNSTGAAAIFGVTGGVMEAALRTAADVVSGKDLPNLNYEQVRGLQGIKDCQVNLSPCNNENNGVSLNVAVCHQMSNVKQLISEIGSENASNYHFVEVMVCPGGCVGGGGLPQNKDPDILSKRIQGLYSLDERKVKRKSHENADIKRLYRDLFQKPLSAISRQLLHTSYSARPRKSLPRHIIQRKPSCDQSSCYSTERSGAVVKIIVVYGTVNGTSQQAATEIKSNVEKQFESLNFRSKVAVLAGNEMSPDRLFKLIKKSFLSIFVTPTYDTSNDLCFPDQLKGFWDYVNTRCNKKGEDSFESVRFAVFGLGSTMYSGFEESLFNKAAKALDKKLSALGGDQLVPVGLGDDIGVNHYHDALEKWLRLCAPRVLQELEWTDVFQEVNDGIKSEHSNVRASSSSQRTRTESESSDDFPKNLKVSTFGSGCGPFKKTAPSPLTGPVVVTVKPIVVSHPKENEVDESDMLFM